MIETILQYVIPSILTTVGVVFVGLIPYLKQRKAKKRTFLNGWEMRGIRNERIRKSLDFYEDKATEIIIALKNRFSILLDKKKLDKKVRAEEMRIYSNCIERAINIRHKCFLHDVRENHFHLRDHKEHMEYVEQKVEAHLMGTTKEITDMYFSKHITLEELGKFLQPILDTVSETMSEVYDFSYEASSTAIERAKKILDYEDVSDSSEREWWIDKI